MSATTAREAYEKRVYDADISDLKKLRNLARELLQRVISQIYLNDRFAEQARTLKLDIFQYCREAKEAERVINKVNRLSEKYGDRTRWIKKYGSCNWWQNWMDNISLPQDQKEQVIARLLSFGTSSLTNLKTLWKKVKEAEDEPLQKEV